MEAKSLHRFRQTQGKEIHWELLNSSDATNCSWFLKHWLQATRLRWHKQGIGNSVLATFPTSSPRNLLLVGVREKTRLDGLAFIFCNTSLFVKQIVLVLMTHLWGRFLWGGLRGDVCTCLLYGINRWSIMHLSVGVPLLLGFASRLCDRLLWTKSQPMSAAFVTYLGFYCEGEGHSTHGPASFAALCSSKRWVKERKAILALK